MNLKELIPVLGVALFGMVIIVCSNGLTFTGLTVFDDSLIETFDWSKSTLKFRDFLNLAFAAFLMPFVGAYIDKLGAKRMLIFGLLLLSGVFLAYSYIGNSTHMYIVHLVMAIALSAAGTLAVIIMVSQRVSKNRGLAIGIAVAGTSMGGIIMPKVAGYLVDSFGWRQAFRYEALIPIGVALLVFLFLSSDKGNNSIGKKTSDLTEVDFKEALKSGAFWFLSFIGFFSFYAILGTMGNLYLYMTELGFDRSTAINALGLMSSIMLVMKFVSGVLTDYVDKFKLFRFQIFVMFLGAAFFALYTKTFVWYGIVILAVGWGGLYTLINYIIITTFGVNSAGKIGGTISTFESLGAGLGIWMSGLISDYSGNYSMSFQVVAGALFIAFILSFVLKPVKADEGKESQNGQI